MQKISIVTPCYNASNYIEETMLSVLNQKAVANKKCEIDYIICDGGSTDQTLEVIQKLSTHPNFKSIKIISEPDRGMYDALAKGLKQCSGSIVTYINAGDYYHSTAFDVVLDIFKEKKVDWLTGYNTVYNEQSSVVFVELPYRYRRRFISLGFYGRKLPPLQQESTFWSSSLLQLIDYDLLSSLRYAGDYYIWSQFAKEYQLCIAEAYLGGFRVHKGQLSGDTRAYYNELDKFISDRPNILDYVQAKLDYLLWYTPGRFKKKLNRKHLFRFSHSTQTWL